MSAAETNSGSKNTDKKGSKKKSAASASAFSYKEKGVLEFAAFSAALPDGFTYKDLSSSAQGAIDFAAWTPATLSEEAWEDGRIIISAASESEDIRYAFKDGAEALKQAFESVPGIKENSKEIELHKEEDGERIYCYIRQKINGKRTNFCCITGEGSELRQFKICFTTGLSKEKMERSVLEWLKTVQIKAVEAPAPVIAEPAVEPVPEPIAEAPVHVIEEPAPAPVIEEPVVEPVPEPIAEAPAPVIDPRFQAIEDKKQQLAAADAALEASRNKKDEAAKLLDEAERSYSRLLSDQLIEEESTKLQLRSLEAKIAERESIIADLKRKRRDEREKKEEFRKNIGNLEPERRAKSKEIAKERKALEDKLNLLADEKAEIQEEKADKKSKLQSVFLFKKKKQQEYNEVKSRLKEKNIEITACDEEIESLEAKDAELKANVERERARLNKEIARLDFEEKELRKAITAEEEEIKKISKEVAVLQEKIKDYKLSIANAAKDMIECKKEFDLCTEAVGRQEAERKLIAEELEKLENNTPQG